MRVDKSEDFYIDEQGNVVFTAEFLKKRGFCCGNGCRNCPYPQVDEIDKVEH